jgi:hypothetical protein
MGFISTHDKGAERGPRGNAKDFISDIRRAKVLNSFNTFRAEELTDF